MLLSRITSLALAEDLVIRKQVDLCDVSKKTTKILTKHTGNCDEGWHGAYSTCESQIKQLRINKCLEVSSYSIKIDELKEINSRLNSEQDYLRDRLIEEHEGLTAVEPTAVTA